MKEDKITATISLDDLGEATSDDQLIVRTTVQKVNAFDFPEIEESIKEARAEYISTNQSLKQVAEKYGIAEKVLRKHCGAGKWNVLKKNPDIKDFMLEVVNEVYGAIDVYEYAKFVVLNCMKQGEYQNPRDIATLLGSFKLCNDEINKLRIDTMQLNQPVTVEVI